VVIEGGDVLARVLGGMDWAVGQGVRVLSMSLGLRGWWDDFQGLTRLLRERNILPVFAIGNEGPGTSRSPGNYPESLSVGAHDPEWKVAEFSSSQRFTRRRQPLVPDLVAPGVGVVSAKQGGGWQVMDGTSMATPHVAGAGVLLMSRGFTAAQAWYALTNTAHDLGGAGKDTVYGYGRIDALAAVNSTPTDPPPPPPIDTLAPSVWITSPAFFSRVIPNTQVTIRTAVTDNVGVTKVEFYVDFVGKCVDTTAPFTCNWVVPPGRNLYYLIEAYAFDAAGNYAGTYTIVYTR
jgi:subtilisin family serine protease